MTEALKPKFKRPWTWEEYQEGETYKPEKMPADLRDKEWRRAGGGVQCDHCKCLYSDHFAVPYSGGLTLLCDGSLVKL